MRAGEALLGRWVAPGNTGSPEEGSKDEQL